MVRFLVLALVLSGCAGPVETSDKRTVEVLEVMESVYTDLDSMRLRLLKETVDDSR